jgi:S-adenosylmethionine hydrolase
MKGQVSMMKEYMQGIGQNEWHLFGLCKCRSLLCICIFPILLFLSGFQSALAQNHALVFQTDFGQKDGAVASMKGVAFGVDNEIPIFDLTHEIPPFNIWEAAYRLSQTVGYWPPGTIFVSVVDPGVGTGRRSVVLKTQSGHIFVTPDNGTLTLIADQFGIEEVRQIDESTNRLKGSELSHTFHGRDLFAYTGARLAAGVIGLPEVGPRLPNQVVAIPYQKATLHSDTLHGTIPILDSQYGNVWTNIDHGLFRKINVSQGDRLCVEIFHKDNVKYSGQMPYVDSFGDVPKGQPLVYLNSLLNVSIALNWDSFAENYGIGSGSAWTIALKRCIAHRK